MLITDDIHGRATVTDPLLLDLLQSRAVTRLSGVSQAGAASLVRIGRSATRLEHSIGVMLLVRRLGGDAEEQAAGLLHDISHTAFSHTIDYVFGDRKQEFHEQAFDAVFAASDLPSILQQHGLDWEMLSAPQCMQRVDANAPLLCADRIDYTLRDLLRFGHISHIDAIAFLENLSFIDGVVACRDVEQATNFASWYRFLVEQLFMNPLELYANDELARILREGLRLHLIEEADLFGTDVAVLKKIRTDPRLSDELKTMIETAWVCIGQTERSRRIYSKVRIVDPPVVQDGSVEPLSCLLPHFNEMWDNIQRIGREGLLVAGPPLRP